MLVTLACLVLPGYFTPPRLSRTTAPRMQQASAIDKVAVPAHERFLSEVALIMPPNALTSAVGLLVSRGEEVVEPGRDSAMHPLLVPLTRAPDGSVTGLLRWPAGGGGGSKLPLVQASSDGQMLSLLANSVDHFLLRAAAVADAEGASEAAALAALCADAGLPYEAGAAAAATGGLPGYLLTKVGPFVGEYESLAKGHLAKGSETSALVTCERTQSVFPAWGRPCAFHARMLAGLERDEEARDKAREALELPLWTLGDALDETLAVAQMDADELVGKLRLKADGKLTPEQLRRQNGVETRSPKDIAKDRASYLLDLAVAAPADYTWAGIREELAELYGAADMASIADFVRGPA